MKKLFLTSSTITENLIDPFEGLVGKSINGLKTLFVPDAAFGVRPYKGVSWVREERNFLSSNYSWEITDLVLQDISTLSPSTFLDVDVVFVNGGFSGYLANEMRRTGFDKALFHAFETGITYVGSSAGSMVCSKTQYAADFYIGEPEAGAKDIPGLGLVDFEMYPHYTDDIKDKICQSWGGRGKLYLLKDGEAIIVEGNNIKLFGEERLA